VRVEGRLEMFSRVTETVAFEIRMALVAMIP
jgi:hypothetical protein